MTKQYIVVKRSQDRFAVLELNPEAGKEGVVYAGDYLTLCTTDGPDEAARIADAMNNWSVQS